ncbi:MAG: type II toxin-antitoxin system VapC family toxin [Gammaproteobacteria bacterium]
MIFLDTNVLIDILKDNQKTQKKIASLQAPFFISSITAMELIYGARNKQEVQQLQQFIQLFDPIHLNESISARALQLITQFAKSHTLDIPDALIAASAIECHASLFTYNRKDFKFIPHLTLIK